MKFEIELKDSVWQSLVEISRAQNDKTPAITVEMFILQNVKMFLQGKGCGIELFRESIPSGPTKAEEQRRADLRAIPKTDC